MSADNWETCPNCYRIAIEEYNELGDTIISSYGEIPRDEYMALVRKYESGMRKLEFTLREDYEIGIYDDDDGAEFYVSYKAQCSECGFSHIFKHTEKVKC